MNRRIPLLALALSGLLWGCSAPLTKVALEALSPSWLTAARFTIAAVPLLLVARHRLRAAASPGVLLAGALGYGAVTALWNEGLARTSVTHGALMVGSFPALVALVALVTRRGSAGARAWTGFAFAAAGVAMVASGGGAASLTGDAIVLAGMALSAVCTVWQSHLLAGRDAVAVTAVQFGAAAAFTAPLAAVRQVLPGSPALPVGSGALPWTAVVALAVLGTLAPFTLFAWGQSRTTAEIAGSFLNLEPLVGCLAGTALFGDPFGGTQLLGGAAVLLGISLSALPEGPAWRFLRRLVGGGATAPRPVAAPALPRPARALDDEPVPAGVAAPAA